MLEICAHMYYKGLKAIKPLHEVVRSQTDWKIFYQQAQLCYAYVPQFIQTTPLNLPGFLLVRCRPRITG